MSFQGNINSVIRSVASVKVASEAKKRMEEANQRAIEKHELYKTQKRQTIDHKDRMNKIKEDFEEQKNNLKLEEIKKNYESTRENRKTGAETRKIEAEAKKIKAQTNKINARTRAKKAGV